MDQMDEGSLCPLGDGAFAWVQPDGPWWVNNAGAVVTRDGVIVIDTCATERRTRSLLRAVSNAAHDAPISFAVNTHQHGDHAYGNSLLPAQTVIIGHEETHAGLMADPVIDGCPPFWDPVPDWGNVTRRPPTLTTNTELTIHCGDKRIELRHPGYPAHTTGDLIAWLPEHRILFTGDLLFNQVTPLVFTGSLDGALRALDWMAGFGAEHVVPGHGPLIDGTALPDVLDTHRRYYRLVTEIAHKGLRDSLSPLEAALGCDLGAYEFLPDAERIVLNLYRAYADITGTGFDVTKAFVDAVTFHGGPLRTIV